MDVLWLGSDGLERRAPEDLEDLLRRERGFVWVDIPQYDQAAERVLTDVFQFHPWAIRDCQERSIVPKLRPYADHVFVILHSPEPGEAGQIRLLELDQFMGPGYLVTVHGPLSPEVPLEEALRETRRVLARIEEGRFRPGSPAELSYALVSAIAERTEALVSDLAREVSELERRVLGHNEGNPEPFLEQMFRIRHEFLSLSTLAAGSREIYERLRTLSRSMQEDIMPFVQDLADQFDHVGTLCDGEKEFLHGILDHYVSRTTTQMNMAMKRLTLIAALALPLTAVASIYGMNLIAQPRETDVISLVVVVTVMALLTGVMLRWAKRQRWW